MQTTSFETQFNRVTYSGVPNKRTGLISKWTGYINAQGEKKCSDYFWVLLLHQVSMIQQVCGKSRFNSNKFSCSCIRNTWVRLIADYKNKSLFGGSKFVTFIRSNADKIRKLAIFSCFVFNILWNVCQEPVLLTQRLRTLLLTLWFWR